MREDRVDGHATGRVGRATGRVGLVDDHAAVALGVAAALDGHDDLTMVATAATVQELLGLGAFDVVLLDLRLADRSDPASNVARLRAAGAEVLVYTSGDDPALVRAAARTQSMGVVRKTEPVEVLVDALRQVLRGEVVASADWAAALDADEAAVVALSPREREVLGLYAAGEKADRVAHLTGLSRETVVDYVRRIRVKYAAAGRPAPTKVDLYRRALEDGLLQPPRVDEATAADR